MTAKDKHNAIEQIKSLEYIPNQYEFDDERVQEIVNDFEILLEALVQAKISQLELL